MYYNSFPKRLNEAMNNLNMKQIELSNKTGLDRALISNYLAGNYKPKEKNLKKIAEALQVDINWLMGYDMEDNVSKNGDILLIDYDNLERIKENIPKGIYDFLDLDDVWLGTYSNSLQLYRLLNSLEWVKTGVRLNDGEIDKIIAFIKVNKGDIREELMIAGKLAKEQWERFVKSSLYQNYREEKERGKLGEN